MLQAVSTPNTSTVTKDRMTSRSKMLLARSGTRTPDRSPARAECSACDRATQRPESPPTCRMPTSACRSRSNGPASQPDQSLTIGSLPGFRKTDGASGSAGVSTTSCRWCAPVGGETSATQASTPTASGIASNDAFLAELAEIQPAIYLQFDGCHNEKYRVIRSEPDILDEKLKALERLVETGCKVVLIPAVERA